MSQSPVTDSLPDKEPPEVFSVQKALGRVCLGASSRILTAASNVQSAILAGILFVPRASANYPYLDSDHTYDGFVASSSNDSKVSADVNNFIANSIGFQDWTNRASQIRSGGSKALCTGNLSIALSELGSVYAASSSGATTLLTLIPTAGALIGAPAKELWVLYKLMPIAGVLSMLLSLGGNIVPMEVTDYEHIDAFTYSGLIPTADQKTDDVIIKPTGETEADRFASRVHLRAIDPRGARKSVAVYIGIVMQMFWLGCILLACWFLESGSIIAWWCNMTGWMYFWYAMVAVTSLIENLAGVPFSHQWTIRVSRAPKVQISDDAPWVIPESPEKNKSSTSEPASCDTAKSPSHTDEIIISTAESLSGTPGESLETLKNLPTRLPVIRGSTDILTNLERGYNTVGRIVIDNTRPWSASNDAFYVILSIKGISNGHAFFRIFGKLLSVGVFSIGTSLFASSTLVTILAAMVTATLILCAGIFGRVTAMWMASEMMKNEPVLHRVVQTRDEAGKYMEAIFRKPGIACEVLGHVIVDGRCVKKFGKKLRLSSFLGVLASPYDLSKLAMNSPAIV